MRLLNRLKDKNSPKNNKNDDLGISESELLRRLEEKGCPVCDVLGQHDRKYFSWFSIEKYHDPLFLKSLAQALGFCERHGAYLDQRGHWGSQITSVHKYIASHILGRLSVALSDDNNDLKTIFQDRTSCPVCLSYQATSERTLRFFNKMIKEKESRNKYGCPGMLCFPHFKELSWSISPNLFSQLLSSHEEGMLSSTQALETIKGKNTEVLLESEHVQNALNLSIGREQNSGNSFFLSRTYKIPKNRDPVVDFISSLKKNKGCPVCLEVYASLNEWVHWLNKNITSTNNFEAFRDVLPTCNTHVWMCIRLGQPVLQIGAVYTGFQAALEKVGTAARHLKQMKETQGQSIWKRNKVKLLSNKGIIKVNPIKTITSFLNCPLCSRIDMATKRAFKLLFALLQERQYRIDFEDGYGLCLKHFADALDMQPSNKIGKFLIRVESANLAFLEWELEETIRKTAWATRPEIKGSEQSAWHRALAMFSSLPVL